MGFLGSLLIIMLNSQSQWLPLGPRRLGEFRGCCTFLPRVDHFKHPALPLTNLTRITRRRIKCAFKPGRSQNRIKFFCSHDVSYLFLVKSSSHIDSLLKNLQRCVKYCPAPIIGVLFKARLIFIREFFSCWRTFLIPGSTAHNPLHTGWL